MILIQFYGSLKERFGEKMQVNKKDLKENTIFSAITNKMTEEEKLYFIDLIKNNPYLIIFKNEESILIENIYHEKVMDKDILKIYLSVSGG